MIDNIEKIARLWSATRQRLDITTPAPLSLSPPQLHTLFSKITIEQVHEYKITLDRQILAETIKIALEGCIVPATLVEVIDDPQLDFDELHTENWSNLAANVISDDDASLESKVSTAEIVLLNCEPSSKTSTLNLLADVLDTESPEDLPSRTCIALGLVGALTGHYISDDNGHSIEFLNSSNYQKATALLIKWRFKGKLWKKIQSSDANDSRDSLLRKIHELLPNANYAGVSPSDFINQDIISLESRVGRPVLIHLATLPSIESWIDTISELDLSDNALRLLDLLLDARPSDRKAIVSAIDANLADVDQLTYEQSFINHEDGFSDLFKLESYGISINFPEAFFDAAISTLAAGETFELSKIPNSQCEKILSGVWLRIVEDDADISISLLENYIGLYVQGIYDKGGREQFTQKVLPNMLRSKNTDTLSWAVDFLFARHRRKSTIPDESDAEIQAAITDVYPQSNGRLKYLIERLSRKKWFSLPARPIED